MEWYATEVWGRRIDDDDGLFEIMCLQVFQAGLTWRMILARRDAFRAAFDGWRIDSVAAMGPEARRRARRRRVDHPQPQARSRRASANAQTVQGLQREHGSFCAWFYDILPGDDLGELQRALRATFRFMGPEIARMWLMASGRIPPADM